MQTLAPTLLTYGDDNRHATACIQRGEALPFNLADEGQAARSARDFIHPVIDTGQRPKQVDLHALSDGCDLLMIVAVPAGLGTDGLILTLQALQDIGDERDCCRQRRSRGRELV